MGIWTISKRRDKAFFITMFGAPCLRTVPIRVWSFLFICVWAVQSLHSVNESLHTFFL